MSRYRGPRFKIERRLGSVLIGLIRGAKRDKLQKRERNKKKKILNSRKKGKGSKQYNLRLKEKQRLRFHYGLSERQLIRYMHIAAKSKGSTSQVLLQLLEMRLDNIVFRLRMALTIPAARQLVNHRHILVNDRIVDIPSYRCKPEDIITIRNNQRSKDLILKNKSTSSSSRSFMDHFIEEQSEHLHWDSQENKGRVYKIIDRKNILLLNSRESFVVEYYSQRVGR